MPPDGVGGMNYRINQWFYRLETNIPFDNFNIIFLRGVNMKNQIDQQNAVVAVFKDHRSAEEAVRKLASSGLDMTHFSIVGQGFHSEEKVVGFYNISDRIKFWGKKGAFWGGIWSLFVGGIFLTIPVIGPVMVLGHLATWPQWSLLLSKVQFLSVG